MNTRLRNTFIAACVMMLFITAEESSASAQSWFTIGPKLGYTFGKDGGFAGGLEVSYFPNNSNLNNSITGLLIGFTCDLTLLTHGRALLHVGAEGLIGAGLAGLDFGPTLVFTSERVYPALTFIPFFGVIRYPFYEYTVPFFHLEPITTIGGYIKVPVSNIPVLNFN
jgi:hypothetical protein